MLIEGLEIINKVEIMEKEPWFTIIMVASLITAVFTITMTIKHELDKNIKIFFYACAGILLIMSIFAAFNSKEKPTGKYRYEVILDDTVNLKEFYQKYEVIEIKGDLYTIKEKE